MLEYCMGIQYSRAITKQGRYATRRPLPPGQAMQQEQQMAAVKRMGVKMGQTVGLTVGRVVGGRMQEPESWIVGIGGLTVLGLALGVLG